jgi:hypothetical protein
MGQSFQSVFVNYSHGFKGLLNSDFKYEKIQLYYKQPIIIGPLGRTNVTVEMGKTFGTIPLGLLSVIPGIKLILLSKIPLATLIFMSLYLTSMRRCNGIIILRAYFLRIPFMRKLNWRNHWSKRCLWNYFRCQQRNQCFRSAVYGS